MNPTRWKLVAIIFTALVVVTAGCEAKTNDDEKFRFEDYRDRVSERQQGKYKTTNEGLEDLRKLHPFGSDLVPLLRTLTTAGAVCAPSLERNPVKGTEKHRVLCHYGKKASGFWGFLGLVSHDWRVVIEYDREQEPLETLEKRKGKIVRLDSPANAQRKIVSYTFSWDLDGL